MFGHAGGIEICSPSYARKHHHKTWFLSSLVAFLKGDLRRGMGPNPTGPRSVASELLDTQVFLASVDRRSRWRFLGIWKNSKTAP